MQYSLKSLQRALAHTLDRPLHGIDLLRPFCNDRVCGSNTDHAETKVCEDWRANYAAVYVVSKNSRCRSSSCCWKPTAHCKKIAWPFWTSGKAPSPSYDTIRDAILTCARKPTWVGLIYRTEMPTTTKNCKTEKLKSKSRYVSSNSKSLGNHVVSS